MKEKIGVLLSLPQTFAIFLFHASRPSRNPAALGSHSLAGLCYGNASSFARLCMQGEKIPTANFTLV